MDTSTALATVSKAVAGAIVSALVALAARYGFNSTPDVVDALGVIVTAALGLVVGFVGVYVSPANRR